ncbi:LysR family transcriptional regulator, partial [Candidatus Albibeggiatoa sp. nov. BB20]|uniref:LysR family transcriptional regulator n=1 Tax=Candidatus Albibeggiatoa sp. nov. BB20 TaxID=3162723 RepID=UPI003365AECE
MNLKQLLFAQSVAETCSFSQAAEMCHATQPTLSNSISQLEDELGGKLFVRTTRKVDLTVFGEYMLPFIRAVLDDKNELQQAAQAYHNPEHKLLRIGLSPLIDMKLLNHVLIP